MIGLGLPSVAVLVTDATLLREAVLENIPVIARGNSERMNK